MTEIWLTADSGFWTWQASLRFYMACSAAAKPRARPHKVIAIQDLDALKAKKQQLKQDLKETKNGQGATAEEKTSYESCSQFAR